MGHGGSGEPGHDGGWREDAVACKRGVVGRGAVVVAVRQAGAWWLAARPHPGPFSMLCSSSLFSRSPLLDLQPLSRSRSAHCDLRTELLHLLDLDLED
jgi:hypothetical protein